MPIGIGLAVAGLFGAGASIFGASSQVSAEQQAMQIQQQMFQQGLATQKGYVGQAQGALSPFISGGQGALDWYNYLTGTSATVPGAQGASQTLGVPGTPGGTTTVTGGAPSGFNPTNAPLTAPFTAATLPYTPGYQFSKGVGLESVQNAAAGQGLGVSGNALKGAADYATGLAGSTYNQQFANYLSQNQQIANMLLGGGQVGATAAEEMASIFGGAGNAALGGAVNTGAGVASSAAGVGNALAGGAAGVANSVGPALLQYQLYNKLLNTSPGLGGGTPAGVYSPNAFASSGGTYGQTPFQSYGLPYDMSGTFPGGVGY